MTKQECLKRHIAAAAAHQQAIDRLAKFAVIFGAQDSLTKKTEEQVERARTAANDWRKFANLHASTRNAMVRRGQMPEFVS